MYKSLFFTVLFVFFFVDKLYSTNEYYLTAGPLISYFTNNNGYSGGGEFTFGYLRDSHEGAHSIIAIPPPPYFWITGGFRYLTKHKIESGFLPYGEIGTYLLLNIGIGYSNPLISNNSNKKYFHIFIGLPVILSQHSALFIEPYVRKSRFSNEYGILFKRKFSLSH